MKEWTEQEVKSLKRYLEAGFSTSEIGRRLGYTKNAVVGKVHRLKLRNDLSNVTIPKKKIANPRSIRDDAIDVILKERENQKEAAEKEAERRVKFAEPFDGYKMKLIDLPVDSCVWPVSEDKDGDFCFCGHQVVKNKSYCLRHCQEAYNIIEK